MAMIGEVQLFAGNYAPRGWAKCDGAELNSWTFMALYGILGDKYGGNGMDKFALPNIAPLKDSDGRGESIYIVCLEGDYPGAP